ncbi:YbbR-like domain-containing protein [Nonlabens antarcticus]|uniref:hypothetical protein n=1 Tax=Nonlabens antarcticus TaxID=392714 RepID=UPI0018911A9A|nr:hypothetical protein [Nonlabens antarcticus]
MTKSDYSKFFSFIAFTLAAAILWFLFRYNDTYVEDTTVKIEWSNVPVDIKLNEKSKKISVPIKVQASGFTLLWLNYAKAESTLDFKQFVKSSNGKMLYSPANSQSAINIAVGDNIKILEIDKKTIQLDFERFASKRVSLEKEFKLRFTGNYQQVGENQFDVEEVTITGNDDSVASFENLKIDIEDIEVSDSLVVHEIDLKKLYPKLNIKPQKVSYTIHAAQMTEGSLRIPITILNKPADAKVKLIPESVNVIFSSRLKDYDSIDASDFAVTVDMTGLTSGEASATPAIIFDNKYINEARVQPQSVQILIIQ